MMDQYLKALLPTIEHFHQLGYWAAFLAALLETALVVGLLLPGSTLLLLLGALAAGGHLDFMILLWFAVAGAVLGDNINYWLGQRYGARWAGEGLWGIGPEHFAKAQRFFDRHGARSVFIGRFIPSVKELAPLVAGTVGMRRRSFMLWNVLGAVGWGLQWLGGGYLFGQSLQLAQTWMTRAGVGLVLVLAAWAALWLLQRLVVRQGRHLWRVVVSLGRSLQAALSSNPLLRRWARNHPGTLRFLLARIDRTHFLGLPLTLMGLAFLYALALFAGVVEDVVTSDATVAADHAVAQWIAALRPPGSVPPLLQVTTLGSAPVIAALVVVTSLLLWRLGLRHAIAGLLVSVLGSTLFGQLGKLAFQRTRPTEALILESSYSFPSGHATAAVAFYAFLGYVLIRLTTRWDVRVRLFFASLLVVLIVGLSRVLLGVHYLSDVWAGYLVGTLWLIAGLSVSEWLALRAHTSGVRLAPPGRGALVLGLAALVTAGVATPLAYRPLADLPPPMQAQSPTLERTAPLAQALQTGLPRLTNTVTGRPEQPLGLALLAPDEATLLARLQEAGWQAANPTTPANLLRLAREGLRYSSAPVAPVFWNQRMNDLAFERSQPTAHGLTLETLRLWRAPWRLGQSAVFVGIARDQIGTRWRLLHRMAPDVDAATERVTASLRGSAQAVATCHLDWVAPQMGRFLMGDGFFTQGRIRMIDLGAAPGADRLCDAPKPPSMP